MLRTKHLKMAKQHKTHDATSEAGNTGGGATGGNAMATGARVGAKATGAGDNGQARTMIAGADGGLLQHPNPNPQTSFPPQQPLPLNLLQNPAAFVNTNTAQNAPALPTGEA